MDKYLSNPRFDGIEPFPNKMWLSSHAMHGEELKRVADATESNRMSAVDLNINEVERMTAKKVGCKYAVGLFVVR